MADSRFREWRSNLSQSGDICPVHLGMSRDALRELFGEPNDVSVTSRAHPVPRIWKYDDIEFHFDGRSPGALHLIYSDTEDGFVRLSIGHL